MTARTGVGLADERRRAKVAQGDVAEAVSIRPARLAMIEKNRAPLTPDLAEDIESAIRVLRMSVRFHRKTIEDHRRDVLRRRRKK